MPNTAISRSSAVEGAIDRLTRDISTQGLRSGDRLQPLRSLAERYSVSYATMQKALDRLSKDDVLDVKQGAGIFIKNLSIYTEPANSLSFSLIMAGYKYDMSCFPVYAKLLYGLESEMAKSNSRLSILRIESPDDIRKNPTLSEADGFFLFWDDTIPGLREYLSSKPCIWLMGKNKIWGDHITYDGFNIGKVAVEYLSSKGHRSVAYVGTNIGGDTGRKLGFKVYSQIQGLDVKWFADENILNQVGNFGNSFNHSLVEKWLDEIIKEKVGAIFAETDALAALVYNALERKGVIVGRDIEILGCNCEESILSSLPKKPASVDVHAESIGRVAVERMKWRIKNPDEDRMVIKLEPKVRVFE